MQASPSVTILDSAFCPQSPWLHGAATGKQVAERRRRCPLRPAQFLQASFTDAEVMSDLMEQGDSYSTGQLLGGVGRLADRCQEERDPIRIRPCVGAALRQRNPLVEPEEPTRWTLVIDDDRDVFHLRT